MVHLAIIGDVHHHFSQADLVYFNDSAYDLILIVGDLSDYNPYRGYQVASVMSGLRKPTLMIPGNHDTVNLFQLLAELTRNRILAALFGLGQARRTQKLQRLLEPVVLCGYSCHTFLYSGYDFDVISARPFSMGGPGLSFIPYLKQRYGVESILASTRLLKRRINESTSKRLIFLAHNGPHGRGSDRADIWGCDFKVEEGDYGDWDLRLAIEYARARGRQVIAVVAGHMHHELKGGGSRRWHVVSDGIHYLNAARVPRIFVQNGRCRHHHLRLSLDEDQIEIEEMLV
jgi:uncharacterized protein (TIGR04168 family)